MKKALLAWAALVTALFCLFGGFLSRAFVVDELPTSFYVNAASLFSLMAILLVALAHKIGFLRKEHAFGWALGFVVAAIGAFFLYNSQFNHLTFTFTKKVDRDSTSKSDTICKRYLRSDDYTQRSLDQIKIHGWKETDNLDSLLCQHGTHIDDRNKIWNKGAIERSRYTLLTEYILFILLSSVAIGVPLVFLTDKSKKKRPVKNMKIVCLGWGSLLWKPGGLPIDGPWQADGPLLPVEFARQSKDGRITLVIDPESSPVQVFWASVASVDLAKAKEALQIREGTSLANIGAVKVSDHTQEPIAEIIRVWCKSKKFDAAIWTALPPKFKGLLHRPTAGQVVDHLRSLQGDARSLAEEYIRKAPAQINTAYRQTIIQQLGWGESA